MPLDAMDGQGTSLPPVLSHIAPKEDFDIPFIPSETERQLAKNAFFTMHLRTTASTGDLLSFVSMYAVQRHLTEISLACSIAKS